MWASCPAASRFFACEVKAEYLVTGQEWIEDEAEMGAGASGGHEGGSMVGSPETVKPIYVRAPDADMHITKMKDPWADGRDRR